MQHITSAQEKHLTQITALLSMYRALSIGHLKKLYPKLEDAKLQCLLKRLEKGGRLAFLPEQELVLYSKDCAPDLSTLAALWVLLDFFPEVTYHTPSDFPVALTFFTAKDAYDVIHVPEEKEILINHALSIYKEDAPRRLAIVDRREQIPLLTFPGISAFCMVQPDGKVLYFKKQGVTDTE